MPQKTFATLIKQNKNCNKQCLTNNSSVSFRTGHMRQYTVQTSWHHTESREKTTTINLNLLITYLQYLLACSTEKDGQDNANYQMIQRAPPTMSDTPTI